LLYYLEHDFNYKQIWDINYSKQTNTIYKETIDKHCCVQEKRYDDGVSVQEKIFSRDSEIRTHDRLIMKALIPCQKTNSTKKLKLLD
jgi:hypothetical protein